MSAKNLNPLKVFKQYRNTEAYYRFVSATAFLDRCLFRTTANDIGSGPSSCHPGDQVWVLENSRVPFILRPKLDSFELIRECFLHGIMDGELLGDGQLDYRTIQLIRERPCC